MTLEAFGSAWKFGQSASRSNAWILSDTRRGETIAEFAWAVLNNSSEADALNEKCRFHGKLDNCEVEVETQNIYPFGGESLINRTAVLRDKLVEIRIDVQPGRGEVIRQFELEPLFFPGEFTELELIKTLPGAGKAFVAEKIELVPGIVYESAAPWAVMLLTDADGFQIELGTGGDWWRMLGCGNTLWQIEKTAGGFRVTRKVVDIAAEEEIQRRPWRFNYYLAWGRKTPVRAAENNESILTPELKKIAQSECFRAPAVRKVLRKLLRQQQEKSGNAVLMLPDVKVCDDAGHLERPGKKLLRHWDLDELFALYSWGNRSLGSSRDLRILLPEDSIFRKYPSIRYLSNHPGEVMLREI